jgi:hypothetical protein
MVATKRQRPLACPSGVSIRFISAQKLRTRRIGRRVVIPSEDIT